MRFRFVLNSDTYGSLVLQREPDGWKDIELILKRSLEYHGIFNEAMAQLTFTCNAGKEYIDRAIEEIGVDAEISILIQMSCASGTGSVEAPDYSIDYSDDYGSMVAGSGAPIFETLYEGILNLENYSQTKNFTITDIIQSDFVQKIINRLETVVEITRNVDLDGNDLDPIADFPSSITMHSKALTLKVTWLEYEATDTLPMVFPNDTININFPMTVTNDDIGGALDVSIPLIYTFFGSAGQQYNDTPAIFENSSDQSVTLDFNISVNGAISVSNERGSVSAGATQIKVYLQVVGIQFAYTPEAIILQNTTGLTLTDPGISIPLSFNYVASHTIAPGDRVFFTISISDVEGDNVTPSLFTLQSYVFTTFDFSVTNISVTDSSDSVLFKIHETGSAIAQRITGLEDPFRSNLLGRTNTALHEYLSNGCMSFAGFMNGKHIRGFGVDSSAFFMSMRDYYKTIDSIADCGLSIYKEDDNYYVQIDPKEDFYDTDVVMQCPRATIKISSAKEYYTSDITIGYEKWETENINGLDEFNTKRQYNTGIKAIESRKNFLSPCVASMYSIELTRRKGVSTIDSDYDKDNFIVCTGRGVDGNGDPDELNVAEKNEHFDSVTNVLSPETAYNLRISPARNALRHIKTISGSIQKFSGRPLRFVYGEGNYTMVSNMDSSEICDGNYNNASFSEDQDIIWDDANVNTTPIWIPEFIEFEYPLRFSEYLEIKDNKFKCIEVSESEDDFIKGYIIEIRYKPVMGMGVFKLLRAYVN
jgi:hypothetical protein